MLILSIEIFIRAFSEDFKKFIGVSRQIVSMEAGEVNTGGGYAPAPKRRDAYITLERTA
jgi:hypothetical protein